MTPHDHIQTTPARTPGRPPFDWTDRESWPEALGGAALLAEQHVAPDIAALLTYLFTEVLDGRHAHVTDGVARALGRRPRSFHDYAFDAAATGVWTEMAPVTR